VWTILSDCDIVFKFIIVYSQTISGQTQSINEITQTTLYRVGIYRTRNLLTNVMLSNIVYFHTAEKKAPHVFTTKLQHIRL